MTAITGGVAYGSPGTPAGPQVNLALYADQQAQMAASVPPELPRVVVPATPGGPHWAEMTGES